MRLLVAGGAGFIGSQFVRARVRSGDAVVVLDKLTYAGDRQRLAELASEVEFVQGDICDEAVVERLVERRPDAIVNFAAETHVDRSIHSSAEFVRTNVLGTQVLLDAATRAGVPRFCQISTDEVYGSAPPGVAIAEDAPLNPSNPYAASKAAADLLALSYHRTHGTPVVITRGTNTYGPYQHPEKLIPFFVMRALAGEDLPLYGDGLNERDWLHADDHCDAVGRVLERGRPGEVYNVGAGRPIPNIEVVRKLLARVGADERFIRFVKDRPAHDRRYALDSTKIRDELGWRPRVEFDDGLALTVDWYAANGAWLRAVAGEEFRRHVERQFDQGNS